MIKNRTERHRAPADHPVTGISRRRFMTTAAAAGVAALTVPRALGNDDASRPPNIVLIFTDDLGYGDVGCYGSTTIRTPNIDRLAEQGVKFTDFYACSSVCTPSRAGLLTGRYPARFGLSGVLFPHHKGGLPADELTIAGMLKQRGYATLCAGKWHLGRPEAHLPTSHGFDEFVGIPYSNDMLRNPNDPDSVDLPLMRGTQIIEAPARQEALTEQYTEAAVDFIQRHRDQPFFVYLPHSAPHTPLHPSEPFRGKSKGGKYGDVVEEIDASTGRILDTLERLGLEQNTLVIFTSDNGPWLTMGDNGGSPGPLRGGKGMSYEGGFRVPCVARWPGHIPRGLVETRYASMLDWLPTFAGLSGATLPRDRAIDGVDIGGLLNGRHERADRPFFYYPPGGTKVDAVRSGRWKLKLPKQAGNKAFFTEPIDHGLLLFDLEADPHEDHNLVDTHPDIVARLQKIIEQHHEVVGKPPAFVG